MQWLDTMNKVMEYIENNIDKEIDVNEVAKITSLSVFHFYRMFYITTGYNFGEYVRKRKLSSAAQDIISTDKKIIDIALKYGYETPESFSRAFKNIHGISPSKARSKGGSLTLFPRLKFKVILKGDKEMNYKILDKPSFRIIGKSRKFTTENNQNLIEIPKFWQECCESNFCSEILKTTTANNITGKTLLASCMNFSAETKEFDYLVGVESNDKLYNDLVEEIIPASKWAIFESVGKNPDAIQEVWNKIYSEWFPSTGYEHAGSAEMEIYPEGENDDKYCCEVWIPIKSK